MAIRLPNPPVERPTPNSQEAQEDQRQLGIWRNEIYRMCQYVGKATPSLGSLGNGAVTTFTISVIGCRTGQAQAVSINAPATIDTNLMWSAFISANDTVTVRVYNPTGSPIAVTAGEWSARVFP